MTSLNTVVSVAPTSVETHTDPKLDVSALSDIRPTSLLHRTPWRPPVAKSSNGIRFILEDGQDVIDGVGGAAVACIGMGNKRVEDAMKAQIDKLPYVYSMQLSSDPAEAVASRLVEMSKPAFELCGIVSGGSEAMEAAIKLARQYYYEIGQKQRKNFVARKLSYHGNTLSTLCLSYHPARRAPYEGIISNDSFHHVSPAYHKRFALPNETEEAYVNRLQEELDNEFQRLGPDTVIAFVAETVVGATTGVVSAPKGYFQAMKSVCDKYGALLIFDEVMCGMGRMGSLHAWQSLGDNVAPDIQAVAKGLGGGYTSIGAVLMNKKVADGVRDGSGFWQHGHTYQSHPIACAGALAVQDVIAEGNLLVNCREQGEHLRSLLMAGLTGPNALAAPYTFDVRGSGGFWGIEFDVDGCVPNARPLDLKGRRFGGLVQACALRRGLVIIGMSGGASLDGRKGDHAILAPPYNVTGEETEEIARIFIESVEETLRDAGAA